MRRLAGFLAVALSMTIAVAGCGPESRPIGRVFDGALPPRPDLHISEAIDPATVSPTESP